MRKVSDKATGPVFDSNQMSLFDRPHLNVIRNLKASMREAIKNSKLSRDQIAQEMTEIARVEGLRPPGNSREISKTLLDKWVSDSSAHIIPLAILPVFCAVTESTLPLQALARALGLTIIAEQERKILSWAEAEIEKRRVARRARRLAEEIGI